MSDKVAMLLARVTAGTQMDPGGGGTPATVNTVMAAVGMGPAGLPGTLIMLANYCDDQRAHEMAEGWLNRWAWSVWAKTGNPDAAVTVTQMQKLVRVALNNHINPATARYSNLKQIATYVGVTRKTFSVKYRRQYERIRAEIAYMESHSIEALKRKLG